MRVIYSLADVGDAYNAGRCWTGYLRRGGPALTVGQWADFSYAAGTPVANYYASAPLAAATLTGSEGIFHGPDVNSAGYSKFLHRITVLPPATSIGTAVFQVLDVVMYYPFIDGDGGAQSLTNGITIPRYSGAGCKIIAVGQGQGTANGTATVTYTNQDGTPNRSTGATVLCGTLAAGQLWSNTIEATALTDPSAPFLPMQRGDTGARSIESIDIPAGIGGIFALCIVKPLGLISVVESSVNPVEIDLIREAQRFSELKDGAYVSVIGRSSTSATPTTLHASLDFVWG